MSTAIYKACLQPIAPPHHRSPPVTFLDKLIDAINSLPDQVFEKNNYYDIYSVMEGTLGPYSSLLHRKAVMCEVLRVLAGFETDWDWNAGVDVTNPYSMNHKESEETGAFQVSWDSIGFDESLKECLDRLTGAHDVQTFIGNMKSNYALAVEYCARLLRFNTRWCGTINNPNQVVAHVSRDAVAEFEQFLRVGTAPTFMSSSLASVGAFGDQSRISTLLAIASDVTRLDDAQARAGRDLLAYDGETYPTHGCAITLSVLLRDAGIDVPLLYMAIELGNYLNRTRNWQVIEPGSQQRGDIGSTCGDTPRSNADHIYLVLEGINDDEMVIVDNQSIQPHTRFASGKGGKTPTKFFLRATR